MLLSTFFEKYNTRSHGFVFTLRHTHQVPHAQVLYAVLGYQVSSFARMDFSRNIYTMITLSLRC